MNILRQGTVAWSGRNLCLKKSRERFEVGVYKNGNPRYLFKYKCATCKEWYRDFEVEVDHIDEVGSFNGSFDDYIKRMYCEQDNLQTLCCNCHLLKTKGFVAKDKFSRKF